MIEQPVRTRRRLVRPLAMVGAGLMLLAAFGLRIADARADNTLGSYSIIAAAPGFEFTEDEPSAQAHPEGQGAAPYTTSMLTSGDYGYALSTIAWPGAYGGNAGSLVLVALPSQAGGVPIPDAVRDGVKTAAPSLQYPIRAEARAGSAPEASYSQIPGTTLTSHADPVNALATANVQGANQQGAATYGNMHSESNSTINGNSAKATASSLLQDVDIGGVVKIKSVTSNAIADSNGQASGATIVQGMTVGGQKVYLDDKGLQIGDGGNPQNTNAVVAQAVNQALAGAGMKIYVSQPHGDNANGTTTYNAGSVFLVWHPPSNPSENEFLLTLGGATVSVAAGQGFGVAGNEVTPPAADTGGGGGGDTSTPAVGGLDQGTGSVPLDVGGTGTAPAVGGGVARNGSTSLAGSQSLAATFGGVGAGWLLLAFGAAIFLGVGSWRLITDLLDRSAATCPLEVQR